MTFFIVTLFRSFDEKNEMDQDEDDLNKVNIWNEELKVNDSKYKKT